MSREQDAVIAKAMGIEVEDFRGQPCYKFAYGWLDVPDYATSEGLWLVLDYIRENPDGKFALAVSDHIARALDWYGWVDEGGRSVVNQVLAKLTPQLIKEAAYEAAKG